MHEDDLDREKAWLSRARMNREDFAVLYEHFQPRIYAFCYRLVVDRDLAEDLTSETFLRVQRTLSGFQWQNRSYARYLYRTARNLVYRHARRAKREVRVEGDEVSVIDPSLSQMATLLRDERWKAVRQALTQLDPKSQDIFVLFYWDHLTVAQISEVLEMPEGTVKTKLQRGRTILRALLKSQEASSTDQRPPGRQPDERRPEGGA